MKSAVREVSIYRTALYLPSIIPTFALSFIFIVLINPQYAPKVINKHDVDGMVDLIELTAKQANVDLFERFAIMRYWYLTEGMPFASFTSPDELHMNDWSYGCVAKLLAGAIHDASTRSTVTATVRGRR